MNTGVLTQVHEHVYQEWQQHIIYKNARGNKGGDRQEDEADEVRIYRSEINTRQLELVAAVANGPADCSAYLLSKCGVADTDALRAAVPSLPNPLTAQELRGLPKFAEIRIAESLDGVAPVEAASPVFWASCHAVWIEQDYFGDLVASFLEGQNAVDSEARVRNFLRRTGGLERVRGKVSVFVDCPISMAWWRVRIARKVVDSAESGSLSLKTVHEILHDATIWAELTGLSVKRLTSLNAPIARAAVVAALVRRDTLAQDVTRGLRKAHCHGALRAVARLSYGFSLNNVPYARLLSAAESGIEQADSQHLVVEPADLTDED